MGCSNSREFEIEDATFNPKMLEEDALARIHADMTMWTKLKCRLQLRPDWEEWLFPVVDWQNNKMFHYCSNMGGTLPLSRMVRKRGYHLHFKGGTALDMIFADADRTGVLIPTRMGTRLLTGAQVVREGAAPNPVQLAKVEAQTREFIDLGRRVEAQPWHGDRPCMPDMLPVVGALSKHRGLWLNTGHGHQGFTLGPTTAELLADDMLTGQTAHPVLRPARLGL